MIILKLVLLGSNKLYFIQNFVIFFDNSVPVFFEGYSVLNHQMIIDKGCLTYCLLVDFSILGE
ncbi:copper-translocating P-type ATPase [Chryseobacterium sp. StRB126]|nr:copper-translocating P-type ATPase [Chryseobacterium sp. StRB126]